MEIGTSSEQEGDALWGHTAGILELFPSHAVTRSERGSKSHKTQLKVSRRLLLLNSKAWTRFAEQQMAATAPEASSWPQVHPGGHLEIRCSFSSILCPGWEQGHDCSGAGFTPPGPAWTHRAARSPGHFPDRIPGAGAGPAPLLPELRTRTRVPGLRLSPSTFSSLPAVSPHHTKHLPCKGSAAARSLQP